MPISDLFQSVKTKRCPSCGKELEAFNFYSSRSSADGLQSYCKKCQRRYREKHPEKEWKWHKHDPISLSLW